MPEHGTLFCISPPLLEMIKATPSTLELFISGAWFDPEWASELEIVEEWKDAYPEDYSGRERDVYAFIEAGKATRKCEMGTSWWLLHYVFTLETVRTLAFDLVDESSAELRVNAICGGQPIEVNDSGWLRGWSADRYFEVLEVCQIAENLTKLSSAVILQRFDQRPAMEARIVMEPSASSWINHICDEVKAFYHYAAREHYAVLSCIC